VPAKDALIPWVIMFSSLGDHVLTCRKHTGSICSHNYFIDVLANLARSSEIGSVRANHYVSTAGNGSRKRHDVEILPFSLAGFDGHVIECSIACEFASSSCANGVWRNDQLHTNAILEARARVKTNKFKDFSALVQNAF